MALDLFKLRGSIEVDNKDANKSLQETSGEGQEAKKKLSGAFQAIGKGAAVVGKAIVTGLAVGGAAMAGLTVKAMSLAGELEQNMGGSEAVFKEYAGQIQETARNAFSEMGLSTADYLATANKMGALFQGAGFSIEESMNLSSDAMQRAADVASIMGIDTASAMEAVAGAAKGNFTMMDNLGVAMNDTTLQAYALEKGIKKSTSEMTNQEKIGLAMEMFMDKTAYAAGNYANENETLAGSLGTAKAALTNFLDGSGSVDQLVGAFSNAATVIVKNVTEILPRLVTGLGELVQQIVPLLPPLLQQLLPAIINGATGLINGLVTALPSILSALMGALPAVIQGVQSIFNAVVEALPMIMESLMSALPTLLPMLIDGIVSMIVTLCSQFSSIIQPIIDYLPDIIISIVDALMDNLPALIQGIVQLVVGIVAAIPQIIQGLLDALPTVIASIVQGLIAAAPVLWEGIKSIWNTAVDAIMSIFESLKNFLSNAWSALGKLPALVNLKNAISNIWTGIKTSISNVANGIRTTVSNVFERVKSAMTNPIETAKAKIKGIVDTIKGFFSGMKLNFPKIKMPHFKISPAGWKIGDLLEGKIPKLDVQWYAKAMDNPMIMTKPTIFGYNGATGELMGGGEAGSEVVTGTNTLMNMIQSAVASRDERIIAVLTAILNAIVGGNQEMVQALLSDRSFAVGEREFARLVKQYA